MMILALGSIAMAESACHSQAIGRTAKPLAGAALNSFMTSAREKLANRRPSVKIEDNPQAPQRLAS
jgi:hypothetical protein